MRPKRGTTTAPSPYKYTHDYTENKSALVQCEEAGDHEVHPSVWPPLSTTGDPNPSVGLQCVLCGCWLVVYRGHATGELKDVKVILPKLEKASA